MSKQRLPLALSITALAVALLGSTPIGRAVPSVVPPFAEKAGFASTAGNAAAVGGIKAAREPKPGFLVPLGADGRLPASVAPAGVAAMGGYQIVSRVSAFDATDGKLAAATCPAGKKVVGGGATINPAIRPIALVHSSLSRDGRSWTAIAREYAPNGFAWSLSVRAICANTTS